MREVDWLVRRLVRIAPIAAIALCVAFAARSATRLFEVKNLHAEERPREEPVVAKVAAPVAPVAPVDDPAELVSDRNILCDTCVKEEPPPEPPVVAKAPIDPLAESRANPQPTTLPLKLVGTNVHRDGSYSSATIHDTRYAWTSTYFGADTIAAAGPIVAIAPRYVDFENRATGRIERLDVLGPSPVVQPHTGGGGGGGTKPQPVVAGGLAAELDASIKKVDDTHYQIDRGMVDKLIADPSLVAGSLRARPAGKDGGLKLSGVKPGSAPAKLGLQNGDTVMAINGYELGSNYDKLLELYGKLKSAQNISIQVLRGGKNVTLDYAIR